MEKTCIDNRYIHRHSYSYSTSIRRIYHHLSNLVLYICWYLKYQGS
nr:MAG TPA: hypothetical protein [Caudoviricetes sp.]